ncbi:cell wall hydrolase [Alkalihalobacillus sp. BA299]|uniref:cell wall hydrolase n=1 Tax=Alkalihalobacillus sp. BA299 TaxID=2815938 RepID=UPI001ADAE7D9|nr:cell wall hydrolase [Alkalihalobacillus sp. BA299]
MINILTTLMLLTGAEVTEEEIGLPKLHDERGVYTIDKELNELNEAGELKSRIVRASLTDEEKDLLERLVTAEAKSEPFDGKVAVAEVVLNRMDNEHFPDELEAVVYQEDQFSPVSNGKINKEPTKQSKKAVEVALKGTNQTNGALYFYNDNIIKTSWLENRQTTTRIGQHVFKR